MRKKVLLLLVIALLSSAFANAQRNLRIGYIDMEYILENVPEYQQAIQQLDTKVVKWKGELEGMQRVVDQMKGELDNERVLLTRELIDERQEEITIKEQEIFDYQQKRFGAQGDYILQKQQLIQPIQDQVFNAVQEIASNKKYDFVFDSTSDMTMLYSAERHDMSDQVLRAIGRTARRQQLENSDDREQFDAEEALTEDQEKELNEREQERAASQAARETALEERRTTREAEREARRLEYEQRRQRMLEERQRRKDSIAAVREARRQERSGGSATPPGPGTETEEGEGGGGK